MIYIIFNSGNNIIISKVAHTTYLINKLQKVGYEYFIHTNIKEALEQYNNKVKDPFHFSSVVSIWC